MNNNVKITALIHLFYKDMYDLLKPFFDHMKVSGIQLVFNINQAGVDKNNLFIQIAVDFPAAIIIQTPNRGKDIGGKITLIDLCLQLGIKTDYYILLHDKKSPHSSFGEIWRNKLFRIIEKESIPKIEKMFLQDKKLGLVGAKEFIVNEYNKSTENFNTSNDEILKTLIQKYDVDVNSYRYIGGTMFWIKAQVIESFFLKHVPLDILSTLEPGNVLDYNRGTQTHAWERLLSWMATDQGYKIKGI